MQDNERERGEYKRGSGRPAKDVHRVTFNVSCQPFERKAIQERATEANKTVSKYLVDKALERV